MAGREPHTGREWVTSVERRLRRLERGGQVAPKAVAAATAALAALPAPPKDDVAPTITQVTTKTYVPDAQVGVDPAPLLAAVGVAFDLPRFNTDHAEIDHDHTEAFLRVASDSDEDWSLFDSVPFEEPHVASATSLTPGQTYEVSLVDVDTHGMRSPRSDVQSATAAVSSISDNEPPPAMSKPILSTALGILLVTWDGKDSTGAQMPPDFHHGEIILDGMSAGSVTRSAPTWPISGLVVGSEHTVTLRAVDSAGLKSGQSAASVITVQGVTGPDLEANSVTANAIAAGAVTASKLEAILVLTTRLVAGDLNGTNVSLEPDGLHAYVPGPDQDSDPIEIISISTAGGTGFAVTDASGNVLGRFDTTGDITAQNVFVGGVLYADTFYMNGEPLGGQSPGDGTQGPTINGRDLISDDTQAFISSHPGDVAGDLPWMDGTALGCTNSGRRDDLNDWTYDGTGGEEDIRAIGSVSWNAVVGRSYLIVGSFPAWRSTDGLEGTFGASVLKISTLENGKVGLGDDGAILPGGYIYGASGVGFSPMTTIEVRCPEDVPAGQASVLAYNFVYAGRQATHTGGGGSQCYIGIFDLGRRQQGNGMVVRNDRQQGTATPPPADDPPPPSGTVKTITKDATDFRSFNGGGDRNTFYDGKATQGYYPGNGIMKGEAIFPDFTGTLNGATVLKVEVYTYWSHWWDNSGGVANIGTHANKVLAATWGGIDQKRADLVSRSFPNPGGGWVTLPDTENARWKSGDDRGIIVTAPNTSRTYYGYMTRAKVRITYRS